MSDGTTQQQRTASGKSAAAFRTISEVSAELDVPQHVLRFWETKFRQVRPLKRAGGRRYYRPEDIDLLRRIRQLLYADGYTIKGVQRLLRGGSQGAEGEDEGAPRPALRVVGGGLATDQREALESVLGELRELRDLLRKPGQETTE